MVPMDYVMTSLITGEKYRCSEDSWKYALQTAIEREWEPEGTHLDLYQLIDRLEDQYSNFTPLFLVLTAHMECIQWNGNYTDREGQIVSESDAYSMYLALEGSGCDSDLTAFLMKGSFRIE